MAAGGLTVAGLLGAPLLLRERRAPTAVFIARNQRYSSSLGETIREGLEASGIVESTVRGRRVLLKPNMVEPTRSIPHMTTHPAVVVATAEVFLRWGGLVTVGEGPGHVRDTEMALRESGIADALRSTKLKFADLNYEAVSWQPNHGGVSRLSGFYLPKSVVEADLIVSLPKLKTHHWVGMTASMKNLYGVLPGIQYGWSKNVLHQKGIPETVVDINASIPLTCTVIDGIDCMEGDGPILGSLKAMGLIIVGSNLPAVDATAARIMGLDPERISYLSLAVDRLGPIAESRIEQRGEPWREVMSPFQLLNHAYLRNLRSQEAGLLVS